jgi:hypothetical protein
MVQLKQNGARMKLVVTRTSRPVVQITVKQIQLLAYGFTKLMPRVSLHLDAHEQRTLSGTDDPRFQPIVDARVIKDLRGYP